MNPDRNRPPELATNLAEYLWYCRRYEAGIFVREQVDGRWERVALSELSPERWAYHVVRMLESNILPTRLLESDERPDQEAPS